MIKGKARRSIGVIGKRMLLNSIGVLLIIMAISFSFMYYMITSYVKDYVMDSFLKQAQTIGKLEEGDKRSGIDSKHIRLYEDLMDATVMYMDMTLMQVDSNTRSDDPVRQEVIQLVGAHDEGNIEMPRRIYVWDTLEQYVFKSILSGESVVEINSYTFADGDIILAGTPIRNASDEIVGGIVMYKNIEILDRQSQMLLSVILLLSIVGIILTVILSVSSSRRLTEPILQLTNGARRMAEGHYGEMISNYHTENELDQLAGTLNTLSWRLDDAFKSLKQEQDKLNLVMNTLNEGLVAVDWYMNVIHYNQTLMQLLEIIEVPDKLDAESDIGKTMYDSMRGRKRTVCRINTPSGRVLNVLSSPFFSNGTLVGGAVCIIMDISESERMEQLRKNYVANVSHELRTPLTGIRGMVEPLMDGIFETEDERQNCYGVIYQETLKLEKLIENMLDMSRLQDGRVTIELEPVELDGVLEFAMGRVAKTAADSNITLQKELEENEIGCIGNEDRILQVVTIFLDNAISFTPNGGAITVSARNDGKYVRISVRDTGCGIEPKDIPYIWERFYKSDKSRMRTPGTGLGLAIAKLTVELMHGEIGVESELGKGSEFWFTLEKYEA